MAMLFNLKELVDMMSIGTLLAYTLVSLCVLILRYEADCNLTGSLGVAETKKAAAVSIAEEKSSHFSVMKLFSPDGQEPSRLSALIVKASVAFLCLFIALFSVVVIHAADQLESATPWPIVLATLLAALIVACVVIISLQPQSSATLAFKVPLVPILPAVSALVNIYLMFKLSVNTWLRFGIWMLIGFLIYFLYGVRNSSEGQGQGTSLGSTTVVYSKMREDSASDGTDNTDVNSDSSSTKNISFAEDSRLVKDSSPKYSS